MEHNSILPFLLALALLLATTRICGYITRRMGQPRVLGELLAGVLLGPTFLNLPHWGIFAEAHLLDLLEPFAELGVLLLMFLIGLEVKLEELRKVGRVAIIAGVLGALLPLALTIPVGMGFGFSLDLALFAGVTLAATSVSISAQVLLEIGHLRSKVGNALLATAIIDDVLAILLVSITLALIGDQPTGGASSILLIVVRMVVYVSVALALSWFVLGRIMQGIADHPAMGQSSGLAVTALIMMLVFAWSAESLGGLATITGAFIAGLGLSRTGKHVKHEIEETIGHIAYALLVPIFFVTVGLGVDLSAYPPSALPLGFVLLSIAIISKVGGSGVGALLGGFNRQESLQLGVCMVSRGEVGLIIATLGLSSGILSRDHPLFASLFFVILLTTVVTPLLVRQIFPVLETDKRSILG